jgi:hypothetical protein
VAQFEFTARSYESWGKGSETSIQRLIVTTKREARVAQFELTARGCGSRGKGKKFRVPPINTFGGRLRSGFRFQRLVIKARSEAGMAQLGPTA